MLKKFGGFTMGLGMSYILFSALAFGLSGFFFSQCFKIGDICEQVHNIIKIFILKVFFFFP